jgi:hypothetical protein
LYDDDSDLSGGERCKGKPVGNKKAKKELRKQARASSSRDKIYDMVKSKEMLMNKTLEAKKNAHDREEEASGGEALREDGTRKAVLDERKSRAKENKALAELIMEKNKTIMMDSTTKNAYKRDGEI